MPAPLIKPNGEPLAPRQRITHEQILAVAGQMIDSQIATIRDLGVPQPILARNLIRIAAQLIAGADPEQARNSLIDTMVGAFVAEVHRCVAIRMRDSAKV